MITVRELNVYSLGDADQVSTWSNVPYFFVHSLTARGISVNRININRSFVGKVLNRTAWRLMGTLRGNDSTYDYFRSAFHFANVRRKIQISLRKYPDADANIFLTFSFSSAGMTDKPTVLFCDWTYDHHLKYFANKVPDRLERESVAREDEQIENADLVFVLFPQVAEYMHDRYQNRNIHYIGNVINSPIQPHADIVQSKLRSQLLLFIGGIKYLQGAHQLVAAFKQLKLSHPHLRLAIIGIKSREMGILPAGVTCHGYLDKAKPKERELYYALLSGARMVVNTTPKWGAFSATIESMHFYNPVVTSPYDEFVRTFGTRLPFGRYCRNGNGAELQTCIEDLLSNDGYSELCISAHQSVQEYSWAAFAQKMLAKIEALEPHSRKPPLAMPGTSPFEKC